MAGVRKFQDIMTYSRSTTGTYIGSDGLLKTAAVDEARIEYDDSGNLQGLLLEPERTNQLQRSAVISGTGWGTSGATATNLNENYLGVFPGCTVTSGGQIWHRIENNASAFTTSIRDYAVTVWVKSGTSGKVRIVLRNTGNGNETIVSGTFGSVSQTSSAYGGTSRIREYNLGNGIYRIQFKWDCNAAATLNLGIGPESTTNGQTVIALGAQVEEGAFPTSYVPSTGSAGTRQQDIAYIDIDQFGVKQDRGTFVAEVNNLDWPTATNTYPRVIEMGNTTDNSDRLITMLVNGPSNIVYSSVVTDGSNQGDITYQDFADSVDVGPFNGKVALRYDETSQRTAKDGVLIGSEDATGNIVGQRPFRTRLALRAEANTATGEGDDIRFHIKTLQYYPRKLADHEISLETYYGTINTTYYVTNSGSAAYAFTGGATGNNPTLDVVRGNTYAFSVNASGHPFYLTTDDGTNFSAGSYVSEYTTGVTNSRSQDNTLFWTVDASAPNTLYYQCGNHAAMKGTINITG